MGFGVNVFFLQRRLKRLASTGLPLWITELSLANKNENVTADWFEQVLTIYFAHPAVEGVIPGAILGSHGSQLGWSVGEWK
ncbi:hypothetical protein DPMN_055617 [Dreissena polymorpha]|uniref:Uncharacterized protein n=1 Tax=Dreissena polymorpha TaxID=45954 RepID=A0A9D4HQT2_DREPO|nr:hypothetical protein DPMN_055617 [Dreissena polymorpha]